MFSCKEKITGVGCKSIKGNALCQDFLMPPMDIYSWRLIITSCAEHSRLRHLHVRASAHSLEGLYI